MTKLLISAACVAVIATAGLLFLQTWQADRHDSDLKADIAAVSFCADNLEFMAANGGGTDENAQWLANCLFSGKITQEQVDQRVALVRSY